MSLSEPFFEVKSPEDIKRDAMAELKSDLQKVEGGFAQDMAGPMAMELHKMYDQLYRIRPMVWVNETSGPYLDLAAEDLGIEPRKGGTRSMIKLEIAAVPGYILPAGSTFLTDAGNLFDTDTDVKIPEEGRAIVSGTAREVGAVNNVEAGTVRRRFSNDTRVSSVTNPEPAIGGSNPESDISLYSRIVFARQKPATSGNRYHYEQWALEVDGVGAVRVYPLWNGNGTVKVLIADDERHPVDDAVVAACAAHIEEMRPTTARVTVVSASPCTVNISVQIKPAGDLSDGQKAALLEAIRAQLIRHFQDIALQEYAVTRHWVGAMLIHTDGVADYQTLRLNGERADAAMTIEQIPVLGEVEITWI